MIHYYTAIEWPWKLDVQTVHTYRGVWPWEPEERALYHLEQDPEQRVDLAAAHPERVAELEASVKAWRGREFLHQLDDTPSRIDLGVEEQLRRLGYVE